MLGDGGELRGVEAADLQSVVADDGHVLRYAQSRVGQRAHRADGDDVSHREDRRDLRRAL